jgi:uncharacterized protein
MGHELAIAVALLLIVEGVLPFLNPTGLRRVMLTLAQLSDSQLRFGGLTSMLLGVVLLYILR